MHSGNASVLKSKHLPLNLTLLVLDEMLIIYGL